jgi:hypothetical protein
MREFQWLLTSDNACISDQFNDWIFKNNSDYPGFKITFMQVYTGKASSGLPMETMFIVFEYDL